MRRPPDPFRPRFPFLCRHRKATTHCGPPVGLPTNVPTLRAAIRLGLLVGLLVGALMAGVGSRGDEPPFRYYFPLVGRVPAAVGFPDGVAAGDVSPTAAQLWTRADVATDLTLEVATDPWFNAVVARRMVTAGPATDFTAQAWVEGLNPGERYYFRWRRGADASSTGVLRTAPPPDQAADVRFAYSGDSDGTPVDGRPVYNAFDVLAAVRRDQPDFFIYLGDTIYADSPARTEGPARTLADYRQTYRTNRRLPALTDLLAAVPIYAIWDDHEVLNDYAGQTVDRSRYTLARQAFLEYMPLRTDALPPADGCAAAPLFRVFRWGSLVEIIILDGRSCRSADAAGACRDGSGNPDPAPTLPALSRLNLGLPATPPPGCREAIADPNRTLLGSHQKALFKQTLLASTAAFVFVVNPVPIQQYYFWPYDRWEGYAAERAEILNFIRTHRLANVIFLTTDAHANLMNEVFVDRFTDPTPVAYEAVTGPIAAATLGSRLQRSGGPELVEQFHRGLDLVGLDCRRLDAYAYGLVTVEAAGPRAVLRLQDETGAVLRDDRNPARTCALTLGTFQR
ncbi:MAG: alkaline phosphatase D family protein [Caldilineales bacterium]|nr:alkaline phosphatase D family protein [Caldilineales bacterium]